MTFEEVSHSSLTELFERRREETPEAVALCAGERQLTFGQWHGGASSFARALRADFGDLRGERVIVWMGNDAALDFACAFHAIVALRAIVVPLDDRTVPREAARVIGECEPRAALLSEAVCLELGASGLSELGVTQSPTSTGGPHLVASEDGKLTGPPSVGLRAVGHRGGDADDGAQ
jgi:acyl-CoA synthetase (AMP-forming)/AMP-acid ligase II